MTDRAVVAEVQYQSDRDLDSAGAGPVVLERPDRRQRDQLHDRVRSPRSTSSRRSYSPGQVISNATLPTGVSRDRPGRAGRWPASPTSRHDRAERRGHRPDRRPDRGQYGLRQSDLLDLHRFRHAGGRRDPGEAGLQRRPGLRRRAADRQGVTPADHGAGATRTTSTLSAPSPRISAGSRASPSTSTATSRRAWRSPRRRRPARRRRRLYDLHGGHTAEPDYGGSLFVSDLASGLYVTVTPVAPLADDARSSSRSRARASSA